MACVEPVEEEQVVQKKRVKKHKEQDHSRLDHSFGKHICDVCSMSFDIPKEAVAFRKHLQTHLSSFEKSESVNLQNQLRLRTVLEGFE